ncbi:MAG: alkaline phosphatase family protein [Bacteroidia bacterium]|nr:alkaline phosphatase family protein [Bacteroidia bacterium]
MTFRKILLLFIVFIYTVSYSQKLPFNGPMAGYNNSSQVSVWVQFHKPLKARITYYPLNPGSNAKHLITEEQEAKAENAYALIFQIKGLAPGTEYEYEVVSPDITLPNPVTFRFKTQPEGTKPFDFTVATGSCCCLRDKSTGKGGRMYNSASGYRIYNSIANQKPDYMVWLGDNIYLRNGEWNSFEGVCYRYTHTRSLPELQKLLRSGHHFSTWDDHDYGLNNGNTYSRSKDFALDGFNLFWANPETHPAETKGIYYNYKIGDAEFFMTDDRYFRSPDTLQDGENKAFLGKEQLQWLVNSLKKSNASFKIIAIGTQYLNPNPEPRKEGYWKDYNTEATYLINEIQKEKIEGVLFLTGDVHYTVLSRLNPPGFYPVYDLTVSALTSIQNPFFGTKSELRMPGTFVWNHNFALLKFSGEENKRVMTIEVRDKWGIRRWKRKINASDLQLK